MNYRWGCGKPVTKITQKVVRNGRSKAMFVATKVDNDVLIGYSMCHPKDRWDKFTAIEIALDRAYAWHLLKRDWKIPRSLHDDFVKFVKRCQRYFKDADIIIRLSGKEFELEKIDKRIPFIGVGNDELSDISCRKDDIVIFTHNDGTEEHCRVKYATDQETLKENPIMSFITLQNGQSFLVGINGRFIGKNKSIRMKG